MLKEQAVDNLVSSISTKTPKLNCLGNDKVILSAADDSWVEFEKIKLKGEISAPFTKQRQVQEFLKLLVSKTQFFVGEIRREVSKAIFREIMEGKRVNVVEEYRAFQYKSDGMNVEAMYLDNPEVFGCDYPATHIG